MTSVDLEMQPLTGGETFDETWGKQPCKENGLVCNIVGCMFFFENNLSCMFLVYGSMNLHLPLLLEGEYPRALVVHLFSPLPTKS